MFSLENELKTSFEWAKMLDLIILCHDGWDQSDIDKSFHRTRVTYAEFIGRAELSQYMLIGNKD